MLILGMPPPISFKGRMEQRKRTTIRSLPVGTVRRQGSVQAHQLITRLDDDSVGYYVDATIIEVDDSTAQQGSTALKGSTTPKALELDIYMEAWQSESLEPEVDSQGHEVSGADQPPEAASLDDELLGPVLRVFPYEDANWEATLSQVDSATKYGLTGSMCVAFPHEHNPFG